MNKEAIVPVDDVVILVSFLLHKEVQCFECSAVSAMVSCLILLPNLSQVVR